MHKLSQMLSGILLQLFSSGQSYHDVMLSCCQEYIVRKAISLFFSGQSYNDVVCKKGSNTLFCYSGQPPKRVDGKN